MEWARSSTEQIYEDKLLEMRIGAESGMRGKSGGDLGKWEGSLGGYLMIGMMEGVKVLDCLFL